MLSYISRRYYGLILKFPLWTEFYTVTLKERESLENRLKNLFNKELILRISSLIIFIPLIIIPVIYSNYLLVIIYIFFNSIIIVELQSMKTLISNKRMINTFIILITYTFIIFIILNITDIIVSRTVIEIILVIWIFDTFCYIGGKMIGGKKLIPSITLLCI